MFTTVGTGDTAYYALEAKVNINWIKTDGTKVSLGTPTISFKKNYNTTIKINVDKSINNGITIDIDENGLEDAETYIVDDGNASVEE